MAEKSPKQIAKERIARAKKTRERQLDLSRLGLRTIPDTLFELIWLTELDLSSNRLTRLPEPIGQLSSLCHLNLAQNRIASLPESVGQLRMMVSLVLDHNALASVPLGISQMAALSTLSLSGNELTSVPSWIGQFGELSRLYLDDNRLIELPALLCDLGNLRELYLHGNPSLNIPPEVLGPKHGGFFYSMVRFIFPESGSKPLPTRPTDILDYYFRSRRSATRPLAEAKLVVIGDGEVGKTAIINLLVDGKCCTGNERQTQGIRIVPWQVIDRENRSIRLNIWDFGGQEVMHATHQFFLTERTVYLVVVDARRGQNESRLEYWLKLVQSLASDSPVIIVTNKIDEQCCNLDENTLREKYGRNVRDFAYTSCQDSTGAEDLRRKIEHQVAGLAHVDTALPIAWFDVKDALTSTNRAWMPYGDYVATCCRHALTDSEDQRRLIRFLHDLGAMLNFPDENLADTNVLAPEWVTQAVYRIITSKRLADQKGIFYRRDLAAILPEDEYPRAQQQFIVDVMRKFELCYPLADSDTTGGDRWLVPGLLDANRPAEAALLLGSLRFQYRYRILPASIIARFIVRMFEHLHPVARYYWRHGIVLGIDDAMATVIADVDVRTIDIAVTGGDPISRRNALAIVRSQFTAIHGSLARLDPEEGVPLPDRPEVSLPYPFLRAQEKQGHKRASWWDGRQMIEIDVEGLLNGIESPGRRAEPDRPTTRELHDEVFLSYSRKDAQWKDALLDMLAPALRSGALDLWYDGKIKPSQDWRREIEAALRRARIGVLLVSKHFLSSDFITGEELPFLVEAARKAEVKLSWILVSDCLHELEAFAKFQALHDIKTPLTALETPDLDRTLKAIAQRILQLAR